MPKAINLIQKAIEQHKCAGSMLDVMGVFSRGCISPSYELIFLRSVYFACNGNDFRNSTDDKCNHTVNSSIDLFQSKIGMEQIKNIRKRNNREHSGWNKNNIDPKIDTQLYHLFKTQSGVAFEGLKKVFSENLTNDDELVLAKYLSSYGEYLARDSEEAKDFIYNSLLEKTWKTEVHKGLLPAYLADLHYKGIRVIKDEVEAYRLYLIARKYGSGGILELFKLDEKLSIEQKEKAICLAKKEELETTFVSKLFC
ncbi:MAG: hypothetical protein ISQ23_08195 [Alphaproteobacteria bacterium]|nr:hypothetical protein [Alphaproteobacteria bacterium]